jgi:hypothetical protein
VESVNRLGNSVVILQEYSAICCRRRTAVTAILVLSSPRNVTGALVHLAHEGTRTLKIRGIRNFAKPWGA